MRRLFRLLRWGAFAVSAVIDGVVFYVTTPFSTASFIATGTAALALFLVFTELSSLARNQWRIRGALVERERIVYQTGLHRIVLLSDIWNDRIARWCIGVPVLVAILVTIYEAGWPVWLALVRAGIGSNPFTSFLYASLPNDGVVAIGYVPLLLAIPFTMAHIVEWNTHRFVITNDRVMVLSGIFNYDIESISLERVVDTSLHLSFWDQLLRYGDVILRMTAGGERELRLANLANPILFDKKLRERISSHAREPVVSE